jgi:hypothetical protein
MIADEREGNRDVIINILTISNIEFWGEIDRDFNCKAALSINSQVIEFKR